MVTALLPAASVARQVSRFAPAVAVTGASQDCTATPEPVSVAAGTAVAALPTATGSGETDGASAGAVASRRTVMPAVA